jgi:hypothetical protein
MKGQRTRALHIPVPASSPGLGLTLQYAPLSTVSTIWHILDVPANSPADLAGLLPYSDYIIGTPEGNLHGESGLGELVEEHVGRPLRLYVYNNEFDVTREVTIHPSRDWGGQGALGCVLGFGALHRLPAPLSEPVAGPGEMLFSNDQEAETARFSNEDHRDRETDNFIPATATPPAADFVVPAQLVSVAPPPAASAPRRDRRHGHGTGHSRIGKADRLMDDYFAEGETKSRELDYAPSAKSTPPPPPPKARSPLAGPPTPGIDKADSPNPPETAVS